MSGSSSGNQSGQFSSQSLAPSDDRQHGNIGNTNFNTWIQSQLFGTRIRVYGVNVYHWKVWIVLHHTHVYAHWWSKIHYGYGEKCSKTRIKLQGLLPFIYCHNYGYFSGQSYCTQALGCCSIFIALQQPKVFLFPYTTNTLKAAVKVRVTPGHTSWWSSNWLNDHAISCLYPYSLH